MFIRNRFFIICLIVTGVQQLVLAASTWSIALAGSSVSVGDLAKGKIEILIFFFLALVAYLVSSIGEIFSVKAQNQIWNSYVFKSVEVFCSDIGLSSEKNRRSINQWLSSEALSTIQAAVPFYINILSMVLNVVLTLGVFFFSLGVWIGSAVGVSLIVSLVLVYVSKSKINSLASEVQSSKISALLDIDGLIVNGMFGTTLMGASEGGKFSSKAKSFYGFAERYNKLEQMVACAPIVISVTIVTASIYFFGSSSHVELGVLVALLPRSLQLFGSVHSLSLYLSHFILMRQKIRNLLSFVSSLDKQDLSRQLSREKISIQDVNSQKKYSINELMDLVSSESVQPARLLVSGDNGSGKSSLLKILKGLYKESILVTPGARFCGEFNEVSTGQAQIAELKLLLNSIQKIILLDEWDANLDVTNRRNINSVISKISLENLVVEVRHSNNH
ncbi:hypothetical protein [Pseudomonas caspiana]|uniref:ATP-binding cassette domain-containing protein n=1 Tax=Pseudomonas caspiana TaxID=1451454 RepID=A0A1Y3P6U5_9PSED|nr:hypothetical protein [Pseudomonas caspiana]OUM72534.1 hypothetical protein AUC60_17045 [Pseudomonas caspiana]